MAAKKSLASWQCSDVCQVSCVELGGELSKLHTTWVGEFRALRDSTSSYSVTCSIRGVLAEEWLSCHLLGILGIMER